MASDLQTEVKKIIKLAGGKAIVTSTSGVEFGTPDIIACLFGRMIAFEIKEAGDTLRGIQGHRLREWARSGAVVAVIRSVEQVVEIIDKMRGERP